MGYTTQIIGWARRVIGWARPEIHSGPACGVAAPVLAAAVLAGVTGLVLVGPSASPAAAAGGAGSWQTEQTFTSTSILSGGISCPTVSECTTDGTATTDGGTNWTTHTAPPATVDSISCPSTTVCYAGAAETNAVYKTSDGGTTWTTEVIPFNIDTGPISAITGISCASTTVCVAVDGVFHSITTQDGGATWDVNITGFGFAAISCPTTTFCGAAGNAGLQPVIATSPNGGQTWNAQVLNAAAQGDAFNSISCPSTSECTAVGGGFGSNGSDNGIAYTDLVAGTCPMGPGCNQLISIATGGNTLMGVSCASSTTCTAVGAFSGGDVVGTSAGSPTWTTEGMPAGIDSLSSISCRAVGACIALGQNSEGDAAIIGQVVPPPTTSLLFPSAGATISGDSWLDAGAQSPVGVASVSFELSGGTLSNQVISGSTVTRYGWIGAWNSTNVANGTYTLHSVATDVDGVSTTSAPVTVTVNNPSASTTVLIPTTGSTQSGTSALLDAGSSAGVTAVSFELSGGILSTQPIISGSAPTIYGWIGGWNTTSVPNGTYTLQSVGTLAGGGTITSAPIIITVSN